MSTAPPGWAGDRNIRPLTGGRLVGAIEQPAGFGDTTSAGPVGGEGSEEGHVGVSEIGCCCG
jgi:hypothetical protein